MRQDSSDDTTHPGDINDLSKRCSDCIPLALERELRETIRTGRK